MVSYGFNKAVGLRVQASGVEAENLAALLQLAHQVDQNNVLSTAKGDSNVKSRMALERRLNQFNTVVDELLLVPGESGHDCLKVPLC